MDYLDKLYENYIKLFFEVNYNTSSFGCNNNLDDIYEYANNFWYLWFDETLDLSKKENKDKLYDLLNDNFQYKFLNDNIKRIYNVSTNNEEDKFIVDNYSKIIEIAKSFLKQLDNYSNIEINDLPKLSHKELDKLFVEFLLCIDKSHDMLKTYEYLKKNNKILFLDLLETKDKERIKKSLNIDSKDDSAYFVKTFSGDGFIVMDSKKDISDLRVLVHEFIHYYISQKNEDKLPNFLCMEYPSIFFEILSCNFLIDKGYDTDSVAKLSGIRLNQIKNMSLYSKVISYYMDLYLKNGIVTFDDDINNFPEKSIELMKEKKIDEKELENYPLFKNEEVARDYCDFANFYFSIDPYILNKSYSYIIGNYLALKSLDKFYKSDLTLEEMIEITKNLTNIDLNKIFDFEKDKSKNKKI